MKCCHVHNIDENNKNWGEGEGERLRRSEEKSCTELTRGSILSYARERERWNNARPKDLLNNARFNVKEERRKSIV